MENKKYPTIAILLGDNYTEYTQELIKGFYTCAQREEVNLLFLMRSSLPRDTNAILSNMTGEDFQVHFSSIYDYVPLVKPDALIVAYGSLSIFTDTPDKKALLDYFRGIPCLLLEDISDDLDIPYLAADNYFGMYECVEHLVVEHGYQRIAFLSGPATNHDANERLQAYHDVMHKYELVVTDSMVAYGDYSELVEPQVKYLLDSNPGLEAIVFANDNMAKAGYRICEERGLVVGRDLAITGFDDVSFSRTLNPPLTSVMHDSFLFSYCAIQNAIQLAKGSKVIYNKLPSVFRPRGSCGCCTADVLLPEHATKDEIVQYVHENIQQLVDDCFFSVPYPEEKDQYRRELTRFFDDVIEGAFGSGSDEYHWNSQIPHLKKIRENSCVPSVVLMDHIALLVKKLMLYASDTERSFLQRFMASTQQYMFSFDASEAQSKALLDKNQKWFINSFTKDLLSSDLSLEESLQCIMNRLQSMQIESCYFFLLAEPIEYESAFRLQIPDNLYLVAYCNGTTSVQLERSEWIHVDSENTLSDIVLQDKLRFLTTYVLFSERMQYGILMCENTPQDILFASACSLQIGSFLRFYHLNANERAIQKELETSFELIKEQNSILSFISEYDELTQLLNRRGFMEKVLRAINENSGRNAYILSADLDHLKEINDTFGHAAGDFALKTVAEYLRKCLPENAIIGRISGDEFVSFIISDSDDFVLRTKNALKACSASFNQSCNEPYYIEMSVGIHKCNCNPSVPVTELLQKSDVLLYQEKEHRRASIKK